MMKKPTSGRWSRRSLLRAAAGGSLISLEQLVPDALLRAADASGQDDRVLVVLEMAGGNDGLNTIIPHADEQYSRSRPVIGIPAADTLAITTEIGLHPAMRGMADLLEKGHFGVVQGVGYPEPNRSHFESMDIWHTCRTKGDSRSDGWLGRLLDSAGLGDLEDPPALHLGAEKQPLALMSREIRVPSIESLAQFRLQGVDQPELVNALQAMSANSSHPTDDLLGFVQSSTNGALTTSERLASIGESYKPSTVYPSSRLGGKFETVARLVASGLKTKIYYLRIDGFDTHSGQPAAHAALLREVSEAVSAFIRDVNSQGFGERLVVMGYSEFGRRVAENASEGTDHGTAGPILLAGSRVRSGLIGPHPSLIDLEQGDLKHHIDFRQVYSSLLEQWLEIPGKEILGGQYKPLNILDT